MRFLCLLQPPPNLQAPKVIKPRAQARKGTPRSPLRPARRAPQASDVPSPVNSRVHPLELWPEPPEKEITQENIILYIQDEKEVGWVLRPSSAAAASI